MKIARAANARLDMHDGGRLEISGDAENCRRAREYVELVLEQRKGGRGGHLLEGEGARHEGLRLIQRSRGGCMYRARLH
jgi:hypothetical protein